MTVVRLPISCTSSMAGWSLLDVWSSSVKLTGSLVLLLQTPVQSLDGSSDDIGLWHLSGSTLRQDSPGSIVLAIQVHLQAFRIHRLDNRVGEPLLHPDFFVRQPQSECCCWRCMEPVSRVGRRCCNKSSWVHITDASRKNECSMVCSNQFIPGPGDGDGHRERKKERNWITGKLAAPMTRKNVRSLEMQVGANSAYVSCKEIFINIQISTLPVYSSNVITIVVFH